MRWTHLFWNRNEKINAMKFFYCKKRFSMQVNTYEVEEFGSCVEFGRWQTQRSLVDRHHKHDDSEESVTKVDSVDFASHREWVSLVVSAEISVEVWDGRKIKRNCETKKRSVQRVEGYLSAEGERETRTAGKSNSQKEEAQRVHNHNTTQCGVRGSRPLWRD